MMVFAIHEVSKPELFWSGQLDLPQTTELRAAIPSVDGRHGVCIFRSDSVETVRNIVDSATSAISKNEFYAIDEANVHGLPAPQ
jgi:hypothetical protein